MILLYFYRFLMFFFTLSALFICEKSVENVKKSDSAVFLQVLDVFFTVSALFAVCPDQKQHPQPGTHPD